MHTRVMKGRWHVVAGHKDVARCSAWWHLDRVLTKFALSPGPKLAGLEWAVVQKTWWA